MLVDLFDSPILPGLDDVQDIVMYREEAALIAHIGASRSRL
jgi:hypothetical protein